MTVPLDLILGFHNALRRDIADMDTAAYAAARGDGDLGLVLKHYTLFDEALSWHAWAEEHV